MKRNGFRRPRGGRPVAGIGKMAVLLAGLAVAAPLRPASLPAQTMPGRVYNDLVSSGHGKLARRIEKKLDLRSEPDRGEVEALLSRWEREEGGPDSGYDWLAVTRLWLRAGDAARAEIALHRAEEAGEVTPSELLLDQARVGYLSGDYGLAGMAYWKGCVHAGEAASIEYWLDIEPLATPAEAEEWDRFRRLPASQRSMCGFLRRFWNERALASAMTVNGRIAEHYRRMRFALEEYRRRGGKRPPTFSTRLGRPRNSAFDDRGLIYVRMGKPDRIATFAGNPAIGQDVVSAECYQPNVSWAYDFPEGTRVYHFTSFGGLDDYWMIETLGFVYRCGDPAAAFQGGAGGRLTPVNEHRFVNLGPWASVILQDLYRSRQGMDPRYARMAQEMNDENAVVAGALDLAQPSIGSQALKAQRLLQKEREWTWTDAKFAVESVPEHPNVAANTRLLVEELQFRSPRPGANRVWVNAEVEAEHLVPTPLDDGRFRYRAEARWVILDETGESRLTRSVVQAVVPRRLSRDESLPVRLAVDLLPGKYPFTFVVRDGSVAPDGGRRAGNYRRGELIVRDLSIRAPALSDVAVAADSGGSWSPGGDVMLRASPAHTTGPDGVAYVYFEAYGLTPGGSYVTRVRLEPEGGGKAFDLSFPGDAPPGEGVVRRALRLDLANSPPGKYEMTVTVRDEKAGTTTLPFHTMVNVNSRR